MNSVTEDKPDAAAQAKDAALATLASIKELLANYDRADETKDFDARDDAEQAIIDDALSVEVRSDWHSPGDDSSPGEYRIVITTGGPAVQIMGSLDQYAQPITAVLQYQNWFTPWITLPLQNGDGKAILRYAQFFYFDEQ